MNRDANRLAERRRELVAQSAAQRAALAQAMEPWRPRLALADQGVAALRYVVRRPLLILGGAFLLALLRPRRAGKWLQRGWLVWRARRGLR